MIGRDLVLDGEKFTIIGVMPAVFSPDDYGELWLPSPWDVPVHPLSPNDNPAPDARPQLSRCLGPLETGRHHAAGTGRR